MAVLKQRLHRFNGASYDTIHFETEVACVVGLPEWVKSATKPAYTASEITSTGGTVQSDLDSYLPEVQATDDAPAATKESKLVVGPSSAWVHGVNILDSGSQGVSRSVDVTLAASGWEGSSAPYTQRIFVSGLMAGQDGVIGPGQSASDAQATAIEDACMRISAQDSSTLTITAKGAKPSIDLPVQILLFTTTTDEGYLIGSCPQAIPVTLTVAGWDSTAKTQTVAVPGIVADELKQKIEPNPSNASSAEYFDCNVRATAQATDSLTFTCDEIPTAALTVYVLITAIAETTGTVPVGAGIGVHQYATMKTVTTGTSWTDNGDGWYQQTITIPGTTENTQVDLQNDEDVIDQMEEDGCSNLFVKNVDGTLYLMAKDAPLSVAVTLQVNLKEVY